MHEIDGDAITDGKVADLGAQDGDFADTFDAGDVGQVVGDTRDTVANIVIEVVDPCGTYADQYLAVSRLWPRYILEPQFVDCTMLSDRDGLHLRHSRCFGLSWQV